MHRRLAAMRATQTREHDLQTQLAAALRREQAHRGADYLRAERDIAAQLQPVCEELAQRRRQKRVSRPQDIHRASLPTYLLVRAVYRPVAAVDDE